MIKTVLESQPSRDTNSEEGKEKTLRHELRRLAVRLITNSMKFPPAQVLSGVKKVDDESIKKGGHANLFMGEYQKKTVALKILREFTSEDAKTNNARVRNLLPLHRLLLRVCVRNSVGRLEYCSVFNTKISVNQ